MPHGPRNALATPLASSAPMTNILPSGLSDMEFPNDPSAAVKNPLGGETICFNTSPVELSAYTVTIPEPGMLTISCLLTVS